VGITKHSNFNRFNKRLGMFYGMDIHKVLWADGIMFFKMSMFDSIGLFDTSYFGDKESQDFCYRAHDSGYNNLFVESCTENHRWIHNSITFSEKSKTDNSNFRKLVTESRNIFAKKWYEWEDRQTHLFV
jgi:GT2 family glycosyltransferase